VLVYVQKLALLTINRRIIIGVKFKKNTYHKIVLSHLQKQQPLENFILKLDIEHATPFLVFVQFLYEKV